MTLAAGSTFADYRIEDEACRGGMGVVFRARQLRPERLVALKILAPELAENPEFRVRFERESRIAAALEHPHIIPIYEAGEVDGMLFIAMRYIEGADLRRLIERRGLSPAHATRIVAQVADALDLAHARGLVHRDVKPANILIARKDEQPHTYLTDFGLAKRAIGTSALTHAGELLGTIDYMAPEQIRGEPLDARADVYALACVLYECLTGQVPYSYEAPFAKLWAHVNEPPPSIVGLGIDVPARLEEVLACGMAKRPDQRYRSAGDLGRAAIAALEAQPAPEWQRAGAGTNVALDAYDFEPARPSRSNRPARIRLALPRALRFTADAPFVGRDLELARLRALWAKASGGERTAVAVAGEAGIGKTRLAGELASAVRREGGLVLYGRCDEALAVPYQPFVEALRPYASRLVTDHLRDDLGRLAPELGRLLPELEGLGEPLHVDPETERFTLFEAVAALLEVATRQQPALLVLDDLHWAAGPTLLMLHHLVRSERQLATLIFGAYRESELDSGHPLAQFLSDLQRDASGRSISIGGLDARAIAALLEATAGHPLDDRAEDLVRVVEAQTGGNPFFLRELLAHLLESGVLSRQGERMTADVTAAERELPAGLRQVIGERVGRLSESAQRALEMAAVAGPTFSLAHLALVPGAERGALEALDEAVTGGLLAETQGGEYAFSHALVRQALYERIGPVRRTRLHRGLGEALETLGDPDAHLEPLARHFAEAAADGQAAKAADYALAAGKSATTRVGYEEAVGHYERGLRALELAAERQPERRCELLLMLGEARWSAGELDTAREACLEAAALAERLGDSARLARAALGFGGPLRFEVSAALTRPVADLLERALTALGEAESALKARLMGRLAAALAYSRPEERKPTLGRRALDLARRVGDKAALAHVLATSSWATQAPDTLDERLVTLRELAALAHELGEGRLAAFAHAWIAADLLELGDVEASEGEVATLERLADALEQPYPKWLLAVAQGRQARLAGRLDDCERLANKALALGLEGQDESAAQAFGAQLMAIRWEQGRLAELVDAVEDFAAQNPEMPAWRGGLSWVYAEVGRRLDARRELEGLARDDFRGIPRDGLWLASMSNFSEAAVLLEDACAADPLYELLLPYAARCILALGVHCEGSAARPLALLATTMGRFEDAERHFEDALDRNARIRSPLWVAHTQYDYARMLSLRSGAGDRDKALGLLNAAEHTGEELGLKALTERVPSLRQALAI